MMQRSLLFYGIVALGALVLIVNTLFVVRTDRQAVVLRLGEFISTMNVGSDGRPGLYAKIPFLDNVVTYDKRSLGLTIEGQQILAADQERLIVDATVRWRIVNPLKFYQSAQTEDGGTQRLSTFAESAMRRALGAASSNDIISGRRAELMQAIEADLNRAAANELGVQVIDVRIRHADFPEETRARVYESMRTERQQVAETLRAEGARDATIIRAQAQETSERTRGEGDGQRARIFADAYGRDPEFAAFYRSMRAYETALDNGTPIVVPPDSDFFRYMQSRTGGGR